MTEADIISFLSWYRPTFLDDDVKSNFAFHLQLFLDEPGLEKLRSQLLLLDTIFVGNEIQFFLSFSAAAAAAAGLNNSNPPGAAGQPAGFSGTNPYVIPTDQQYLAALASAGQILPGNH